VAARLHEGHVVTFRTRQGRVGTRLVVTPHGSDYARSLVEDAGHTPLGVRPATPEDYNAGAAAGQPQVTGKKTTYSAAYESSGGDDDKPDDRPTTYASAYRSPAGGSIVRGVYYPGGSMVPNLQKFAPN
jgi:hypothetical protein